VVSLNRAVAIGLADGPAAGLAALSDLDSNPLLATYPYLASSRADFLRRLGRSDEARLAYEEALVLSENAAEREFLRRRLTDLAD
jgi:RNA polymerase sigma-70 factor (ECF subfamily)